MNFDLKRPCASCPFLRVGGIRLTKGRIREIAATTTNPGATFACHKTTGAVDGDADLVVTAASQHCAGALVYADKQGTSSQMARIAERLGMLDWNGLKGHDLVWNDLREWLARGAYRRRAR